MVSGSESDRARGNTQIPPVAYRSITGLIMLTYLSIGEAFILLCVIGGAGFYVGARHVEELSGIVRNPDRPNWAQEPVDAFNSVVGRPTSRDPAAALYDDDDEGDDAEDGENNAGEDR